MRVVLLALILLSAGHAGWVQTNGPTGHIIMSVFALDSLLLAGTNWGAMRSLDGGKSWIQPVEMEPAVQKFAAVGGVLIGTSLRGLYLSKDRGATWETIHAGLPDTGSLPITSLGGWLFAGNSTGVFRSADLGATWSRSHTGDRTQALHAHEGRVFAFTGKEMYRSSDSGRTWEKAGAGFPGFASMPYYQSFASGAGYLLATEGTQVYRSGDGGAQWSLAMSGLPDSSLISLFDDGTRVFAGTFSGLYSSPDGGSSWSRISWDIGGLHRQAICGTVRSGELVAGTTQGVFASKDGGATWKGRHTGIGTTQATGMVAHGDTVYLAARGSVFRTEDAGQEWVEMARLDAQATDGSFVRMGRDLFLATQGQGVIRSSDQGRTWKPLNPDPEFQTVHSLVTDGVHLFAVTAQDGILRSGDRGETWQSTSATLPKYPNLSLAFGGADLYAALDKGVYRSSDQGRSWMLVRDGGPIHPGPLAAAGSHVVLMIDNGLIHSPDRGQSWKVAGTDLDQDYYRSLAVTPAGMFAGTIRGRIYRSPDSGASWLPVEGVPGRDAMADGFLVAGLNLFLSRGGIWRRPMADGFSATLHPAGKTTRPRRKAPAPGIPSHLDIDALGRWQSRQGPMP